MALYMYQGTYTPESWAAQIKNPQNRVDAVGKAVCEAAGGKMICGAYCFGEYDIVLIADMPSDEAMSAVAMAVTAGGAVKAAKTTKLLGGEQAVAAMRQAAAVANVYRPAR